MAAILKCRSEQIKPFFICKTPSHYPASFKSNVFWVQKKKRKIDLQDGNHGGHLGFRIRTLLCCIDLQGAPILPLSIESVGFSVQEKKPKYIFKMAAMVAI